MTLNDKSTSTDIADYQRRWSVLAYTAANDNAHLLHPPAPEYGDRFVNLWVARETRSVTPLAAAMIGALAALVVASWGLV